jgi:hypothetical protein
MHVQGIKKLVALLCLSFFRVAYAQAPAPTTAPASPKPVESDKRNNTKAAAKPAKRAAATRKKDGANSPRTNFDFEGSTVKGDRTAPMGSILDQASPDRTYDFVKIRRQWRKEMVNSTHSLDAKGGTLGIEAQ